jgi:hypothetical protein
VRVLLDHNLPHKLRTCLGGHDVVTASYMGWGELKNGELLKAVEEDGFDVFVTGDRSLIDEQNITSRRVAIVALSANNWPIIKSYIPRILSAIDNAIPGSFQEVECGVFDRRKT